MMICLAASRAKVVRFTTIYHEKWFIIFLHSACLFQPELDDEQIIMLGGKVKQVRKKKENEVMKPALTKIADIGARFALEFVPGGNPVYELAKMGFEEAKKFVDQRREKRIEDFHTSLLKPYASSDLDLKNLSILTADYHALLNACINDIEDEKTELYAFMARNAAAKRLPPNSLRFFCVSLSEMTFNDLEEMRVAYITTKFKIIPPEGSGRFQKSLSTDMSPSELFFGRKMMELRGFVEKDKLNSYGEQFIQACYPKEKLLPASINMLEWKNSDTPILLLSYELDDPDVISLGMHLTNSLRVEGFKSSALSAPQRKNLAISPIEKSILIFKCKPERIINNIEFINGIISKNCIAVQLCEEYPETLESMREKFEKVINARGGDILSTASQVVNAITLTD